LHDLVPKRGLRTRWLTVRLRLDAEGPEIRDPFRAGRSTVPKPEPRELSEERLVGPSGLVRSVTGLTLSILYLPRGGHRTVRIGEGRRSVAYLLDGTAKIDDLPLAAHEGLLSEGQSSWRCEAGSDVSIVLAAAPWGDGAAPAGGAY
jgi:hypothetical protein